MRPMPPVEAALRAAGARIEPSVELDSGARASTCAVVCCKASIALTGNAAFDALLFKVKEVNKRSA